MYQNKDTTPINPQILVELVSVRMPFGKYKDRVLCDLPEPYLVWFHQKGFPPGKIGVLLSALYEIKLNGLEYLLKPIRKHERWSRPEDSTGWPASNNWPSYYLGTLKTGLFIFSLWMVMCVLSSCLSFSKSLVAPHFLQRPTKLFPIIHQWTHLEFKIIIPPFHFGWWKCYSLNLYALPSGSTLMNWWIQATNQFFLFFQSKNIAANPSFLPANKYFAWFWQLYRVHLCRVLILLSSSFGLFVWKTSLSLRTSKNTLERSNIKLHVSLTKVLFGILNY